ncbi:type IV secretion system protein [Halostreptopolyspora alba]|uniref:type IV secretion system protein n=1 Tax=Halostreptopolyspora alba TaxID=2487137 RepID=UPI003719143D
MSNTAWGLSKTINQSTITVYQAATTDGLLASFNSLVESVMGEFREGVWRPLLPTVIILGAVWLGWYGLIRKRLTLTVESAIWMVLAVVMGIWILVNPAQILSLSTNVVNSGTQLVNSAASKVTFTDAATSCLAGAPEAERADWENESDFTVRQNSQMLWSGLVCQPWVAGVFGTGEAASWANQEYGMSLLQAQGISRAEQAQIANDELDAASLREEKQQEYEEIASGVESNYPEVNPLFSGEQQGDRFAVATLALFASIFAGGLILAASVALIVLKIGFLLLLMLSPIFLLVGVHPGYGRTVLLRWFEMLIGLLLKQIFIVLLVTLLIMCYSAVMVTDLGWGLQMILLSLFTVALFVYRKPFAHLFASVNANTFTSRVVNDAMQSRTLSRSANVVPPVAYMRAQKWGLKNSPQLATAASAVPAGGGASTGDAGDTARGVAPAAAQSTDNEGGSTRDDNTKRARGVAGYGRVRGQSAPPPLNVAQSGGKNESPRQKPDVSTQRSASEAPRLSEAASGGLGTAASSGGGGGDRGSIPPRPAGGYTGAGDTGWASIFGTGSGSGQRPPSGGGGHGGGAAAAADQADVNNGRGIFRGRTQTPPRGNVGGNGSRWGGPRPKQQKPSRPPRAASQDAPSNRGEGGNWITGSSNKSNKDAPTSPFWTGSSSQRSDKHRRDVPFWLRDDD